MPSPTPMAVVIVNYNTRDDLAACLAALRSPPPSETVVVDNASSDGSATMVETEHPQVVLLANKTNVGYGTAANQAIACCASEYVLLLNSDTLVEPGTLGALSAYLDRHPRTAIAGPRLVGLDGATQRSCYSFPTLLNTPLFAGGRSDYRLLSRCVRALPGLASLYPRLLQDTRAGAVPFVKGAALAIRRQPFEAVGSFDESFFMYFEEADLCYRLRAAGWQSDFAPVTTVVHVGETSTRQRRGDMAVELYASTVRFYRRHYRGALLAELVLSMKLIMLTRWIRDVIRLRLAGDERERARLAEDTSTWKRVLLGRWRDPDQRA